MYICISKLYKLPFNKKLSFAFYELNKGLGIQISGFRYHEVFRIVFYMFRYNLEIALIK